jgi:hypothetical protein
VGVNSEETFLFQQHVAQLHIVNAVLGVPTGHFNEEWSDRLAELTVFLIFQILIRVIIAHGNF